MRGTLSVLLLASALVGGCDADPLGPIPTAVPLRCGADPLSDTTLIAQGQINLRGSGACGDLIYQSFAAGVSTQTLVSPGRDPYVLTGQDRGFSPDGDRLAVNGATGFVYDTVTGETHDLFEGFGTIQFLRDADDPPRVFIIGCGESEVRLLEEDGTVRTLAEEVVSCPAVAPHAPVFLYQDTDGHLHRYDLRDDDDLLLDEILYSDGITTFPGSGRNDLLRLSSDGALLVHHQRSWSGGREWATITRTTDGEVLGSIPDAQARLDVKAIPGGHVMAITTGEYLWVIGQDYDFLAYEGLVDQGLLADRQLVVWSETYAELFVFEPVTGLRSETIFVDDEESTSRPRLTVSPSGGFFVMDFRTTCDTGSCTKTLLHDVSRERSTVIFEGDGDASTRHVTDAGVVVMEGVFRAYEDIVYRRDIRVYDATGALIGMIADRNLGRIEPAGEVLFTLTYDPMFGTPRLDRIDAATGAVTTSMESVADFRVAGSRLYYQTQPDPMGMTELHAMPIR